MLGFQQPLERPALEEYRCHPASSGTQAHDYDRAAVPHTADRASLWGFGSSGSCHHLHPLATATDSSAAPGCRANESRRSVTREACLLAVKMKAGSARIP